MAKLKRLGNIYSKARGPQNSSGWSQTPMGLWRMGREGQVITGQVWQMCLAPKIHGVLQAQQLVVLSPHGSEHFVCSHLALQPQWLQPQSCDLLGLRTGIGPHTEEEKLRRQKISATPEQLGQSEEKVQGVGNRTRNPTAQATKVLTAKHKQQKESLPPPTYL